MKYLTTIWILALAFGSHVVFGEDAVRQAVDESHALQTSVASIDTKTVCDVSQARQIIATPEEYLKVLRCPEKAGKIQIKGLVGRVLKGKAASEFDTLSNDPTRKLIFLMGSDGLEGLVGMNNDQIFTKIGYTSDYIKRLKNEGYKFKLVVFKSQGDDGKLATWNNVGQLVAKLYPGVASKIKTAMPRLKNTSFSRIEQQAPSKFSAVDKVGKSHPDYVDEVRLEKSEGKLWEVRGFLFYKARLMDLYAGDGFTRDVKGNKGLKEYIVSNKPVKELPSAALTDL
ncbi:MAG: hypothetical protein A2428_16965 [Bdellovibrionales bacterium RIFOXYC1_FULL_54_43]|nr:MAG: hypothetical protein A2428_16965 [Bdellovibrionales bacterium RIFOXYC1_FULL_54_43]HLD99297.1 hypothetical protein [Bdellovibrionota bacterium]